LAYQLINRWHCVYCSFSDVGKYFSQCAAAPLRQIWCGITGNIYNTAILVSSQKYSRLYLFCHILIDSGTG
jgi:hypothetical protein